MLDLREKPLRDLTAAFYGLHVEVNDIALGRFVGQAVDVLDDDSDGLPGTLIYVPGVSAQDVKEELTNA